MVMKTLLRAAAGVTFATWMAASASAAPRLTVGDATGVQGGTVEVPVSIAYDAPGDTRAVSLEFDITYSNDPNDANPKLTLLGGTPARGVGLADQNVLSQKVGLYTHRIVIAPNDTVDPIEAGELVKIPYYIPQSADRSALSELEFKVVGFSYHLLSDAGALKLDDPAPYAVAGKVSIAMDNDGDGQRNETDACQDDRYETIDLNGDGICDNADQDDDKDGVPDDQDDMPQDSSDFRDNDGDGIGDIVDTDDDNDGILDAWYEQPLVSSKNT